MVEENKVTDDDLNAVDTTAGDDTSVAGLATVYEDVENNNEEVVPKTAEELQEELNESHKERSRLGRRVSGMEKDIQERNEKMDATLDKLDAFMNKSTEVDSSEYDTDPVTRGEVEKLFEQRERKKTEDMDRYRRDYHKTYSKLGMSEDPELFEEIVEEMTKNFNEILSGDPASDAERNYLRATRAVLKKSQGNGKKNPLEGKKPEGAIGVGGDTKIKDKKAFVTPKLDEHATAFMDYASKAGMSDEAKERALTGETPQQLKGTRSRV